MFQYLINTVLWDSVSKRVVQKHAEAKWLRFIQNKFQSTRESQSCNLKFTFDVSMILCSDNMVAVWVHLMADI